jgi:hypothetical protein
MSSRRQVLQKLRIPDYDHDNIDSIKCEFITHFWVLPLRPHLRVGEYAKNEMFQPTYFNLFTKNKENKVN